MQLTYVEPINISLDRTDNCVTLRRNAYVYHMVGNGQWVESDFK